MIQINTTVNELLELSDDDKNKLRETLQFLNVGQAAKAKKSVDAAPSNPVNESPHESRFRDDFGGVRMTAKVVSLCKFEGLERDECFRRFHHLLCSGILVRGNGGVCSLNGELPTDEEYAKMLPNVTELNQSEGEEEEEFKGNPLE